MAKSIGIIDSGLGGLSVAQRIWRLLPQESTIYLADHQYFPYGTKTTKAINQRLVKIVDFLLAKNCKLVVIACNTITVSSIDFLRSLYTIPFVGTVPAIKPAIKANLKECIVVLATPKTAASNYLKGLIQEFDAKNQVNVHACPGLVEAIEKYSGKPDKLSSAINFHLKKINSKCTTLVLGCTHYILVKDQIKQLVDSHVKVVEPSQAIAKQTERLLSQHHLFVPTKNPTRQFFTTKGPKSASKAASNFLKESIIFTPCSL